MKSLHSSARLCLLFLSAFLLLFPVHVFSQTPGYSKNGAGTSGNTIPWNQTSQKTQLLYAPTDFSTAPLSGNITKIYFRNSAAGALGTFTNLEIRFMQNNDLAIPSTSFYTTGFTTVLSATSLSVTGNATAGGWFEILLNTPYPYDSTKSLIVEVQYSAKASGGLSTTTLASTGRNTRVSGTSLTATTGTLNTTQNDFGMDILSGPCASPPTAGSTTVLPSNHVCSGSTISLNLLGATSGIGQSYQWQRSISSTGPFVSFGASSFSPSTSFAVSTDSFYRCEVTCNSNVDYSTALQVTINNGISGTFTINSAAPTSGSNFQTFEDAVNAMACGIIGPVVFNVDPASGPYNEQITIPSINGAS
jgi:trimeric autotransporter adhesin